MVKEIKDKMIIYPIWGIVLSLFALGVKKFLLDGAFFSSWTNDIFFYGMLICFICFIWYRKNKDTMILKELDKSILFLNSQEFTNSSESYNDISDEFFNKEKYSELNKIWKVYNSSIVEIKEEGKHFICQTIDADNFYNNDVLLKERMNTKILNYIPQLMVGLGLLGTFLGLSMGLSNLDLKDNSGINELLNGVKTSFYTSLYGMYFSITFTILINLHLGEIEKKILELKDKLNIIFHKNNGSEIVQEIKKEIQQIRVSNDEMSTKITNGISQEMNKYKESNESSMKELSELLVSKIGGFSQGISGTFEKTMGESLEKIFSNDFIEKFEDIKNQLIEVSEKNNMFISEYKNEIKEIAYTTGDFKDSYINLATKIVDDFNVIKNNLEEKFIQFKVIFDNSTEMYSKLNEFYDRNSSILNESIELINKFEKVSDNLNGFINTQETTTKLWESYKESFDSLNASILSEIRVYKEEVLNSIQTYENILKEKTEIFENIISKNSESYGAVIDKRTMEYTENITNSTEKIFTNLNMLINETMKNYEELIRYGTTEYQKVISDSSELYENIISKNSENYGEIIDKRTIEYTNSINKGTTDLFNQYEDNLVSVIDKFNGALKSFNEKLGKMEVAIDNNHKTAEINAKVSEEQKETIKQLSKLKQGLYIQENNTINQEFKGEY